MTLRAFIAVSAFWLALIWIGPTVGAMLVAGRLM